MSLEIISRIPNECYGTGPGGMKPLKFPAEFRITLFKGGSRVVSCPYLEMIDGTCLAPYVLGMEEKERCIQLTPKKPRL